MLEGGCVESKTTSNIANIDVEIYNTNPPFTFLVVFNTFSKKCARIDGNLCYVLTSGGSNGRFAGPQISGLNGFGELRIDLTDSTGFVVENAYDFWPSGGVDNDRRGAGAFSIIQKNGIADGEELSVGVQGRIKNTGVTNFASFRYSVRPSLSSTSTQKLTSSVGSLDYSQSSIVTSGVTSYKRFFFFNGDSQNSFGGLPGLRVLIMNKPFVPPYSLSFVIYPTIEIRDNCLHLFDDDDVLVVGENDGDLRLLNISQADTTIDEIDFTTSVSGTGSCVSILSHPKNESVIYMLTETSSIAIYIDKEGGTYNILAENVAALGSGHTFDYSFMNSFFPGDQYYQANLQVMGWDMQVLAYAPDFSDRVVTHRWCLSGEDYLSPQSIVGTDQLRTYQYFHQVDQRLDIRYASSQGFENVNSQTFCGSGSFGSGYDCDNDYNDLNDPVCCNKRTCDFDLNGDTCGDEFACVSPGTCGGSDQVCTGWSYLPDGTICDPALGLCENPGTCNGTSLDCSEKTIKSPGVICRNSTGACQEDALCNGTAICPPNPQDPPGTLCANSTGACESNSFCLVNGTCPPQVIFPPTYKCSNATVDCQDDSFCIYGNSTCPPNPPDPPGTPCGTVFPDYLCISSQICNDIGQCIGGLPRENGTICNADGQNCSISECNGEGVCNVIIDEPCPKPVFPSIKPGSVPDNSFVDDDDHEDAPWIVATVLTSVFFIMFVILLFVYRYGTFP